MKVSISQKTKNNYITYLRKFARKHRITLKEANNTLVCKYYLEQLYEQEERK